METQKNGRVRRFRVPLAEIGYLRMILEAYDGLAVMSSEPGSTVVSWWIAPGREAEADALVRAMGREIGMVEL